MREPRPEDYDPNYKKPKSPIPEKVDISGAIPIKPKSLTSNAKSNRKTERPERGVRSDEPERGVRVVGDKREIKRHSFDIYKDQVLKLQEYKTEIMKTGVLKSMSAMVREAIDKYLESSEKSPGRS